MVEYASLDTVFRSLADPTRRDMLRRVREAEMSVNDLAAPYDISVAAVSKHLQVLEKAQLVVKERRGKQQFVHLSPTAFKGAADYLQTYREMWESRLDALEDYLTSQP